MAETCVHNFLMTSREINQLSIFTWKGVREIQSLSTVLLMHKLFLQCALKPLLLFFFLMLVFFVAVTACLNSKNMQKGLTQRTKKSLRAVENQPSHVPWHLSNLHSSTLQTTELGHRTDHNGTTSLTTAIHPPFTDGSSAETSTRFAMKERRG